MKLEEYLFKYKTFALQESAESWQDAVRLATDLLESAGAVTPDYYRGILQNHAQNGPYFVIVPSVAMPHAAPETGARENGFSLVTLRTPVLFGHEDHDPVDIILCIAARDRTSLNEEVIVEIMNLLDDDDFVPKMRIARTAEDLAGVFRTISTPS